MTSMNLVFRPSRKQDVSPGSLSLRLIHQRRVKTITLRGCRLYPEEWDYRSQTIIYPADNPARLACLADMERLVSSETNRVKSYLEILEAQGRYSVDDLVGLYHKRQNDNTLLGYVEILADRLKQRGQVRTARAYQTISRGLVRFNKNEDVPLDQINANLVKDFEIHLKEESKLPNTISYYMRNLRAIFNKAVAEKRLSGYQGVNPFSGTYTGVTKTMKRSLSQDELKALHGLDFGLLKKKQHKSSREHACLENLERAHRYFFFSFYARGICFIDLAYLRKDNIRGGVLRYIRKKTCQQIEVRITPEMQQVIDSFAPEVSDNPYLFPIIKDTDKDTRPQYETALRTQNIRLKKLASMAGVQKPVSTHWARHTWATTCKRENVPLRVISECLGHNSEKTTLIYLGALDNSLLDAANDLVAASIRPQGVPVSVPVYM